MLAHQGFHIQPGDVGAFGQRVRALVDLVVEDLQADVGNADIVNIGEDEGHPGGGGLPILDRDVELAADIAAGLLYL